MLLKSVRRYHNWSLHRGCKSQNCRGISLMSRFSILMVPGLLCCVVWGSSVAVGQQAETAADLKDPRIGQKVMVTNAGAELRTPVATVWKGYVGEVFTVSLTNGEWLWIHEKGGWLWEKQCIPFDSAIGIADRTH